VFFFFNYYWHSVGNRHCRIIWDGKEDEKSAVIVADYSSNGTWVRVVFQLYDLYSLVASVA